MSSLLSSMGMMRHYRSFVLGSVKREFRLRYQGSLLGFVWIILQPLIMVLVYTIVFAHLMKGRLPGATSTFAYSIYLCSGILTWSFFTEIITRANSMFIENANLLKKATFPRICLLLIVTAMALVNFVISFILFLGVMWFTGNAPYFVGIYILPILLIELVLAVGLGLLLGTLNVFFRDISQLTPIMLQLWFWGTPIVYPITILSPHVRQFIELNPMTGIISAYQQILVNHQPPLWGQLAPACLFAFIVLIMGSFVFKKFSAEMVDEL